MKRLLFEVHRWVGIVLALFMVLWFFSGLVIIYAEPGTPDRAELLAHAESLSPEAGWLSAGEAWERSTVQRKEFIQLRTPPKPAAAAGGTVQTGAPAKAEGGGKKPAVIDGFAEARLVRQGGEPFWLVEDGRGQRLALSARDGSLHTISSEQALKIAESWAKSDGVQAVSYVETLDKPAILRNLETLRPFHRIAVDDGAGSELLISAVTGKVVHASTRIQRGLYWAGNWVHLFRPLELAGLGESRVEVLKWMSFFVIAATLTGLIIGWLRWRPGWFGKRTYSEGRTQPYREFWFKWHFWAGLIGGTFALFWGVSGFLNNNPWQLFSPANPSRDELARYVGKELPPVARDWQPSAKLATGQLDGNDDANVIELTWRRLGDQAVLLAHTRDGKRLPQDVAGASRSFDDAALLTAVRRAAPDAQIAGQTLLEEYDSYYYLRHHRDAADRPLPVLRVELADAAGTQFYLDPQDGRLLVKTDRSRRVFRWLYSALHHWDIGWLYQRPLWDGWMVLWVLFGVVLSTSSVVIGWRRLSATVARGKQRPQAVAAPSLELAAESQG